MNNAEMSLALASLTGGKNVILTDDLGQPSIMYRMPRFNLSDVIPGAPDTPHPMFIVDGEVKDEIFIGKFLSSIWRERAYSLPGRDPAVNLCLDDAVQFAGNKGAGWHVMTNAERAGIALTCKANGYFPYGNTSAGSSSAKPFYGGIPSIQQNTGTYKIGDSAKNASQQNDSFSKINLSNATSIKLESYEGASTNGTTFVGGKSTVTFDAKSMTHVEELDLYIDQRTDNIADKITPLTQVNNAAVYNTKGSIVGCVIYDTDRYKMWFSGFDGTNWRIMYTESLDLVTWQSVQLALNIGTCKYNTYHNMHPTVIKEGDTFKMWFTGFATADITAGGGRLLYSTSKDMIHWTTPTLFLSYKSSEMGTYKPTTAIYCTVGGGPSGLVNVKPDGTLNFAGCSGATIGYDASGNAYRGAIVLGTWTNISTVFIGVGDVPICAITNDGHVRSIYVEGNIDAPRSNMRPGNVSHGTSPMTWTDIVSYAEVDSFAIGAKSDGTVLTASIDVSNGGNASPVDADKWTDIVKVGALRCIPDTGEYCRQSMAMGLKSDGSIVRLMTNSEYDLIGKTWTNVRDFALIGTGVTGYGLALLNDGTVVNGYGTVLVKNIQYMTPQGLLYTSDGKWIDSAGNVINVNSGVVDLMSVYWGWSSSSLYQIQSDGTFIQTGTAAYDVTGWKSKAPTNGSSINFASGSAKNFDTSVHSPAILREDSLYRLTFAGKYSADSKSRVFGATSTDSKKWSAITQLIDVTADKTFNSTALHPNTLIKTSTGYRLFLTGTNGSTYTPLYVESADGVTWGDTALSIDKSNSLLSSSYARNPVVLNDNGVYRCWFTGSDGTNLKILYSNLSDGKTLYNPVDISTALKNSVYSSSAIHGFRLIKEDTTYKLWFGGSDGTNWRILYSESTDGKTWSAPIVAINIGGTSYNSKHTDNPYVIRDGNLYKMWLNGGDGTYWRIMYSESTDGKVWNVPTLVMDVGGTSMNKQASYKPVVYKEVDGSGYKMWFTGMNKNGGIKKVLYCESTDGKSWGALTLSLDNTMGAKDGYSITSMRKFSEGAKYYIDPTGTLYTVAAGTDTVTPIFRGNCANNSTFLGSITDNKNMRSVISKVTLANYFLDWRGGAVGGTFAIDGTGRLCMADSGAYALCYALRNLYASSYVKLTDYPDQWEDLVTLIPDASCHGFAGICSSGHMYGILTQTGVNSQQDVQAGPLISVSAENVTDVCFGNFSSGNAATGILTSLLLYLRVDGTVGVFALDAHRSDQSWTLNTDLRSYTEAFGGVFDIQRIQNVKKLVGFGSFYGSMTIAVIDRNDCLAFYNCNRPDGLVNDNNVDKVFTYGGIINMLTLYKDGSVAYSSPTSYNAPSGGLGNHWDEIRNMKNVSDMFIDDGDGFDHLIYYLKDGSVKYYGTDPKTGSGDAFSAKSFMNGLASPVCDFSIGTSVPVGSTAQQLTRVNSIYKLLHKAVDLNGIATLAYTESTDGKAWGNSRTVLDLDSTSNQPGDVSVSLEDPAIYRAIVQHGNKTQYLESAELSNLGPVFKVGATSTYNNVHSQHASIIYDTIDGKYKMWFVGITSDTTRRVLYTESYDLANWTSPVLVLDVLAGSQYSGGVYRQSVIRSVTGKYHMWFTGTDGTNDRLFYTTSTNGKNWSTPVLIIDSTTTYPKIEGISAILLDDGTIQVWFSRVNTTTQQLYMISSKDCITWSTPLALSNFKANGKQLSDVTGGACIHFHNGKYYGFSCINSVWYMQTSPDGVNWINDIASQQGFMQAPVNNTNVSLWLTGMDILSKDDKHILIMSSQDSTGAHKLVMCSVPFLTPCNRLKVVTDDGKSYTSRFENSVLVNPPVPTGNFNSVKTAYPCVIKESDTSYKMWFAGYDGTNWRILYSTSTDGKVWSAPVVAINIVASSDYSTGADAPCVIKDGSTYKMWFTGYNGTVYKILYSESTDGGITWTTPIIAMGVGGCTYNSAHSRSPFVLKESDTSYKMWFTGNNGTTMRLLYATSSDGKTWSTPVLNLDIAPSTAYSTNTHCAFVMKESDTSYKLWFSAHDGTTWRIMYASSPDGKAWSLPVCVMSPTSSVYTATSGYAYLPWIVKDNGIYRMWFSGDYGTNTNLLYSESKDGVTNWKHDVNFPLPMNITYTPAVNSGDGYVQTIISAVAPSYQSNQEFDFNPADTVAQLPLRNAKTIYFEITSASSDDGTTIPAMTLTGSFATNGAIQDVYVDVKKKESGGSVSIYSKNGANLIAQVVGNKSTIADGATNINADGMIVTDSFSFETGIPGDASAKLYVRDVYGDPTIVRTLTGTCGTGHDGSRITGIMDLTGNVWEMITGLKLLGGKILVTPNNDSAKPYYDEYDNWHAIDPTGTLVDPTTAGVMLFDGTTKLNLNTVKTTEIDANAKNDFKSIIAGTGVNVPNLVKALGLFPIDGGDHGDAYFQLTNTGEVRPLFGGDSVSKLANGGPFTINITFLEGFLSATAGFRLCYYKP